MSRICLFDLLFDPLERLKKEIKEKEERKKKRKIVKFKFIATESGIAVGKIISTTRPKKNNRRKAKMLNTHWLFGISQYKMVGLYQYNNHSTKKERERRKVCPNGR